MTELFLNTTTWDIQADRYGTIAIAEGSYAIAQSVANEIKLFAGEGWYDTRQGIPHFTSVLGVVPHGGIIRQKMEDAAQNVSGVRRAQARIGLNGATRSLQGSIVVTTHEGEELHVSL